MRVVDRDGLDGLLLGKVGAAPASLVIATRRSRAASASGLQALADASHPVPPTEPALASWTALEPIALVPTVPAEPPAVVDPLEQAETRVRAVPRPNTRLPRPGRHARPTIDPPFGETSRRRRPTARIVLSFIVGGAALTAAVILLTLQGVGGGAVATAPAALVVDRPAPASGLVPVLSSTIDDRVVQRRAILPPSRILPSGRLQWRMPLRYSLGGEAPDRADEAALAALVTTLSERCQPGTVILTGHTCNMGTGLLNLVIGKRRALFARDLLVAAGLPAEGVRVASAAATRPEASNATTAGRIRNRRVTIACQPQRHEPSRGE